MRRSYQFQLTLTHLPLHKYMRAHTHTHTAVNSIIVAGDGRYYNAEAMQIIARVLAGNGVANIWVPQTGIMSTPAVSAAIRNRDHGICRGGIVLTASHNPGGPGEDFGIKYNLAQGQPAGEDFTDDLYARSLKISTFKTVEGTPDFDLDAPVGTTYQLTASSTVTIIDPYKEYIAVLKECFDFDSLAKFLRDRPDFSMIFDGMHGAGGPFANKVLVGELGLPEVRHESEMFRVNPFKQHFPPFPHACRLSRVHCCVAIQDPTLGRVTPIPI